MKNWEKKSSCFVAGNKLDKGSSREAGKRIESVWVKDCFCNWCTLIVLAVRNKSQLPRIKGSLNARCFPFSFSFVHHNSP